jgi:hypothetical protein
MNYNDINNIDVTMKDKPQYFDDDPNEIQSIEVYFPEIENPEKYIIQWKYLHYFRKEIKKLINTEITFKELSLAKIKILELEHIDTREKIDIYFNLIGNITEENDCPSKQLWKNYKLNYICSKKLTDYYSYDKENDIYHNDPVITIEKQKLFSDPPILDSNEMKNDIEDNKQNVDQNLLKIREQIQKLNRPLSNEMTVCRSLILPPSLTLSKNQHIKNKDIEDENSDSDLNDSIFQKTEDFSSVFPSDENYILERNSKNKYNSFQNYNRNYEKSKSLSLWKNFKKSIMACIIYFFFFGWFYDLCACSRVQDLIMGNVFQDNEKKKRKHISILLVKNDFFKDREEFNENIDLFDQKKEEWINEVVEFTKDKLNLIHQIEGGKGEHDIITASIELVNNVIEFINDGILYNPRWFRQFIISEGFEKSWFYQSDELNLIDYQFVYFHNYGLKAVKHEINFFIDKILNEEQNELRLPDIYILTGFRDYIHDYEKDFYNITKIKTNRCLLYAQEFLSLNAWFPFFSIICFSAQIIGPLYYISDYFAQEENDFCPNRSNKITKLFSFCYYLILYAQYSNIWDEMYFVCSQYENVHILKNKYYTISSWVINNLCLLIIPFFTYTLFIENNTVTDLILNCLTGQFLIDIDNLVVSFSSGSFFMKNFIKDKMILYYMLEGVNKNNVMQEESIFQSLFIIMGTCQSYIMLVLSILLVYCL